MNRSTGKYGTKKVVFAALVTSATLLCVLTLLRRPSVVQAGATPAKDAVLIAKLYERDEAVFAFSGVVDIYHDPGQMQAGRPSLAGVKAKGLLRAAGVRFIQLENNKGEIWFVRVDRIIAYRRHPKK